MNLENIFYLGFRTAPFILVFFFIFQSLLNVDYRGIVYIAGVILTSSLITFLNNIVDVIFGTGDLQNPTLMNPKCSVFTLGNDGNVLSKIPLSLSTYSFTFSICWYLYSIHPCLIINCPRKRSIWLCSKISPYLLFFPR